MSKSTGTVFLRDEAHAVEIVEQTAKSVKVSNPFPKDMYLRHGFFISPGQPIKFTRRRDGQWLPKGTPTARPVPLRLELQEGSVCR